MSLASGALRSSADLLPPSTHSGARPRVSYVSSAERVTCCSLSTATHPCAVTALPSSTGWCGVDYPPTSKQVPARLPLREKDREKFGLCLRCQIFKALCFDP